MKVKKYIEYIKELSGTELVGREGPVFGETSPKTMIDNRFTDIIYVEDVFWTLDKYQALYNDYLKSGGSILDGFSDENIRIILNFIKNK